MASDFLRPGSAQVHRWTTASIPPRQRFDYWIGALCDTLFSMTTSTRSRIDFNCRMTAAPMDGLMLIHAMGSNQASFRTRRHISQSDERSYHLIIDLAEPWTAVCDGAPVSMSPGDLIVMDTEQPHGGIWADRCSVANLVMPARWMASWIAKPEQFVGRRIEGSRGWGSALSAMLSPLATEMSHESRVPQLRLTQHIGMLLSMIEADWQGLAHDLRLQDRQNLALVARTVRERMEEPGLDAPAVAHSLGLSMFELTQWLRRSGTTVAQILQVERLASATKMLEARRFDRLSLPEIARRTGVADPRKFIRLAKRSF